MKKFSRMPRSESGGLGGSGTSSSYSGKVFAVGRYQVTVEELIAEGMSIFYYLICSLYHIYSELFVQYLTLSVQYVISKRNYLFNFRTYRSCRLDNMTRFGF
jgi:hypothetical protein